MITVARILAAILFLSAMVCQATWHLIPQATPPTDEITYRDENGDTRSIDIRLGRAPAHALPGSSVE